MHETLYQYQNEGIAWLQTKKLALLADEMGLGKSAQAICAANEVQAKRILVICPSIARINWMREFSKFSEHSYNFDVITKRGQKVSGPNSVICSYDLALSVAPCDLGDFDLLILDEVHFLKSTTAKRTRQILGSKGFIRHAKRTWALSGTPAPNHYGELWPLLYTFGVVSEPYERFLTKFCITLRTTYGIQILGNRKDKIPELRSILDKIMLRRTVDQVLLELPKITFNDTVVEPGIVDLDIDSALIGWVYPLDRSKELKELLEQQKKLVLLATGETGLGRDGMKVLEGLAKSVSTLRMYTGMQKVAPVAEMVKEELEAGVYEKIVIFAIHQNVIDGLRRRLFKHGVVTLYGGTPREKRQSHIDKFQNDPRCKVFIGNILACGTAITLTASNQVLFIEQDWVPGNNAQAAKRCHRIGQEKPVFVRCVAIDDSYDERISQILKRKSRELIELFDKEMKNL